MDYFELDEIRLEEKNIIVESHSLPSNKKAMCAIFDNSQIPSVIFYDPQKMNSINEKRCSILHEEMHIDHPETTYYLNEPIKRKMEKESKVEYLMFKKYIPLKKLFSLLYFENLTIYEIAENLCLTEQLIKDAYDYYSSLEEWQNKLKSFLEEYGRELCY